MKIEIGTGPQLNSDGVTSEIRQGRLGATIIAQLHGKYAEQCARGNVYCSISASTILQSAAATNGSPLCLYNPTGSGKNLYLIRTHLLPTVANAALVNTGLFAYYGVANPALTVTTLGTVNSLLLGSNVSPRPVGVTYSAVTMAATPAPVLITPFATKFGTSAIAQTSGLPQRVVDDVDGQIIIAPGGLLLLQQTGDTTNLTAIVSFVWEEVPI